MIPNETEDETDFISLRVQGYLRGKPMAVNSLMYIVGCGTCFVDSIQQDNESFPTRKMPMVCVDSAFVFLIYFSF